MVRVGTQKTYFSGIRSLGCNNPESQGPGFPERYTGPNGSHTDFLSMISEKTASSTRNSCSERTWGVKCDLDSNLQKDRYSRPSGLERAFDYTKPGQGYISFNVLDHFLGMATCADVGETEVP